LSKRRSRALKAVDNTVNFNDYVQKRKHIVLSAKSQNQQEYINALLDEGRNIVFATGPAGSGKTLLGVMAGIKAFREGHVDKLILTRPAVGVDDEKHGFLPGDLTSKMAPWLRPLFDVIAEYYSQKDISYMLEDQRIEITPLAFMRGRTFKNSWVVFDEAQNSTVNQMKMVLTRLGENSRMVVTGDLCQYDRKFLNDNGLRDFIDRLTLANSERICHVKFTHGDIQRHPVVEEVLKLYGES
jgi:phosphate starvation-inducible PhoH-like protein